MPAYHYATRAGRRWKAQFELDGQLHQKRGFERKRDAEQWEALRRAELARGLAVGGRSPLMSELFEQFLLVRRAMVERGELRSSTYAQDERDVRLHLLPLLGRKRASDMADIAMLERCQAELLQRLAPDSVLRAFSTLSVALKPARRYGHLAFNPISEVEKPRPRRRRPALPTLADVHRLAAAMPSPETRALTLFAAFTGCRKSECLALAWDAVDLANGTARILRQYYKGVLVDATKTPAGAREVLLAPKLVTVLRELSAQQLVDDRPNPHGLVFPAPGGGYWLDTNLDRRVWKPAREAAGLPTVTFHVLRYFFVSHVRAQGLPAAITEQLAGHVDERTHRGYTRPIAGTEPLIRNALERAFSSEVTAT